jgi:DNA invertase Pin-like site-specific DNA recombinase
MGVELVIKSPAMQEMEARLGRPIDEVIRERYEAGADQRAIARELGLHASTVSKWMDRLGIPARRMGPRPKAAA